MTAFARRRRVLLSAALASPLWLAAPRPAPAAPAEWMLGPVEPRIPAPPFSLADDTGGTVSLEDVRGRVALLNFWATWCPPCRAEMPALQRLWLALRNRSFLLYGINVDERPEDVQAFSDSLAEPLAFPILYDEGAVMLREWEVIGLPTTFVLDREANIAYRVAGEREWDGAEIVAAVEALLVER
jgi:peroxiredoxin